MGTNISSFKEEYIELAYNYSLLGADAKRLAELFGVSKQTLYNWKRKQPAFKDAIERGRDIADSEVAKSLFQRAMGYSHEEEKIFCTDGRVTKVKTTKHYPPDTTAMIFWLKNRQSAQWRDKTEQKTTVVHQAEELSDNELEDIARGSGAGTSKKKKSQERPDRLH